MRLKSVWEWGAGGGCDGVFPCSQPVKLFHSAGCLFSCGPRVSERYSAGSEGRAAARLCHLSSQTMNQEGVNWLKGCVSCCFIFSFILREQHGSKTSESPCYLQISNWLSAGTRESRQISRRLPHASPSLSSAFGGETLCLFIYFLRCVPCCFVIYINCCQSAQSGHRGAAYCLA